MKLHFDSGEELEINICFFCFYFSLDSSYCLMPFHLTLKWFLNISYRAGQLATNSFSFCLPGNALVFPLFKTIVVLSIISSLRVFLSVLWQCLSTAFWNIRLPIKSQVLILWRFPCIWWISFLFMLSGFSVFVFSLQQQNNDYNMSQTSLWVCSLSLNVSIHIFLQIWKCLPYYLFIYFFSLCAYFHSKNFHHTYAIHMMVFHRSLMFCSFLFFPSFPQTK